MKKKIGFSFFAIIGAVFILVALTSQNCPCCLVAADDSTIASSPAVEEKVPSLPLQGVLEQEKTAKLPKLLDLGAHKCIPCKKMAPILEELKKEYKGIFDVEFIDVWDKENAKKAEEYKIESIPVQIFFDSDGKEVWRHEGFFSKEEILAKWKELGIQIPQKNDR